MGVVNNQIFSFVRKAFGFPGFLVVMNISEETANCNFIQDSELATEYAFVSYYISGKCKRITGLDAKYKYNNCVSTKNVILNPRDCLVLTWPSSD